jgi:hypothetical protein
MNAAVLQRSSLFTGESFEQYLVRHLGELSASAIEHVLRSPAHYRAWVEAVVDDRDTPAQVFGRSLHCALLEPDRFAKDYALAPDFGDQRFKANKLARADWHAANPGVLELTEHDAARIAGMTKSVRANPLAAGLLRRVQTEVTIRWRDDETGVACKARPDAVAEDLLYAVDVKTCEDARPDAFARSVYNYGYHVQHAHVCDGFRVLGSPLRNYLILAIEKDPPYAHAIYTIDAAAEAAAMRKRSRALAIVRRCIDADSWPSYAADITELSLPPWATKEPTE